MDVYGRWGPWRHNVKPRVYVVADFGNIQHDFSITWELSPKSLQHSSFVRASYGHSLWVQSIYILLSHLLWCMPYHVDGLVQGCSISSLALGHQCHGCWCNIHAFNFSQCKQFIEDSAVVTFSLMMNHIVTNGPRRLYSPILLFKSNLSCHNVA